MLKALAVIVVAAALSGCASAPRLQDGYQLGDATGTAVDGSLHLLTLQQRYCTESDPVTRTVLLRLIRAGLPAYPSEGLCTDVLSILGDPDEIPAD